MKILYDHSMWLEPSFHIWSVYEQNLYETFIQISYMKWWFQSHTMIIQDFHTFFYNFHIKLSWLGEPKNKHLGRFKIKKTQKNFLDLILTPVSGVKLAYNTFFFHAPKSLKKIKKLYFWELFIGNRLKMIAIKFST
jgi:hypothetical protein